MLVWPTLFRSLPLAFAAILLCGPTWAESPIRDNLHAAFLCTTCCSSPGDGITTSLPDGPTTLAWLRCSHDITLTDSQGRTEIGCFKLTQHFAPLAECVEAQSGLRDEDGIAVFTSECMLD